MALRQQDREDLLQTGRAMPFRAEFEIHGVTVLVGFRGDRQVSLYCGADPVFQFNRKSQLRRVFFEGRRIAAEGGRLFELHQDGRGGKVHFGRREIDEALTEKIGAALKRWLSDLRQAADQGPADWRVVEPESGVFCSDLQLWLRQLADPPEIASSPGA
jgi:hypothetical protein